MKTKTTLFVFVLISLFLISAPACTDEGNTAPDADVVVVDEVAPVGVPVVVEEAVIVEEAAPAPEPVPAPEEEAPAE
jgi:hypothetical protein